MKHTKLTFSELKECLGLNSSSLSSHLSTLQDGGLVDNFLEWNEKSYSYYRITDIANIVLESLFNIVTGSSTVKELWDQPMSSDGRMQMCEIALQGQFVKDAIQSIPQYTLIKNPEKHSGHKKNKRI